MVVADPLDVKTGTPPSKNNEKMIDQLLEVARKSVEKGGAP